MKQELIKGLGIMIHNCDFPDCKNRVRSEGTWHQTCFLCHRDFCDEHGKKFTIDSGGVWDDPTQLFLCCECLAAPNEDMKEFLKAHEEYVWINNDRIFELEEIMSKYFIKYRKEIGNNGTY
jgi:hypothetical protein